MRTKIFPSIILLFFCCITVSATQGTPWSLQQCIDHALRYNLDIKQQHLNEDRSQADLTQSYANMFPSLGGTSVQGYNYGRTIDRFTNEFATERVLFHNLYGSSDVVLFSGFQNVNNIRYNIARNTAFRYDTEKLKNDIILAIAGAYLQILYHEDLTLIAMEQLDVIEQQLERSRILFEGGTIARNALLEVEAQMSQQQLTLLTAQNNLRLSYLELIQLLDLDPEEPFTVEKPGLEVDESFAFYDSAEAVERTLNIEPSVMAANSRIKMAERALAIARGGHSPRLSFVAQLGTGYSEAATIQTGSVPTGELEQIGFTESNEAVYREVFTPSYQKKPYKDQITDNYNTALYLTLNIPIFNRLQTRTRVSHSRIDLESAQVSYDQQKNSVSKLIYQSHADALASFQQYLATERSLEAFRESFRFASERFDQGMINAIEYNESRVRLARSQAEALQAKYNYVFMVKILEFYQGEPLSF